MNNEEAMASRARLQHVADIIGADALARLFEIKVGCLRTILHAAVPLSADIARRSEALDTVLERALRVMQPAVVVDWLEGTEPTFGFARPIDVLFLKGPTALFDVLDRLEAGGYA